jgi:hypothetical protein
VGRGGGDVLLCSPTVRGGAEDCHKRQAASRSRFGPSISRIQAVRSAFMLLCLVSYGYNVQGFGGET